LAAGLTPGPAGELKRSPMVRVRVRGGKKGYRPPFMGSTRTLWGAYAPPDPLAAIWGLLLKGGERGIRERGEKGGEGEEGGEEREGWKGKGREEMVQAPFYGS